MISNTMYTDSALHKKELSRMKMYEMFSKAFSYPNDEKLIFEYDKLFRGHEIWLYSSEYIAENEFQRAALLSDIMGFYRAFGVQPTEDRADHIRAEFEFMHYLIFKAINAKKAEQKNICFDAQGKFFLKHLYPGAKKIGEKIIPGASKGFYKNIAVKMLGFLENEKNSCYIN